MGADTACILMCGACWVMWTCDTSHTKTGGMSGGCGSVKCWHGSGGHWGIWMSCARMWGHMKVDDRCIGQMLRHGSHMEWVTYVGEGVLRCGDAWRGWVQMYLVQGIITTDTMHVITHKVKNAWHSGKVAVALFLNVQGAFPNSVCKQLIHNIKA